MEHVKIKRILEEINTNFGQQLAELIVSDIFSETPQSKSEAEIAIIAEVRLERIAKAIYHQFKDK
jgi:hypothetical protein